MNDVLAKSDESRPDVDELLRDYFHAEMPKPWPAFHAPKTTRTRSGDAFWSDSTARFALAACITLLVGGYWALSGFVPTTTSPTGVIPQTQDIGQKPKHKELPRTNPAPTPLDR